MPINPNIILGIQPSSFKVADPLESAQRSLTLQHLMGQQDLQGMQMRQAQQAEADDLATRDAFKGGGDRAAIIQKLLGSGQYKAAQSLEKAGLDTEKARGDINKTRAETLGKLLTFQKEGAGAVLANPTPENALAAVDQFERLATSLGMPELSQQAAQQRASIQQAQGNPEALKRIAAGWALTAEKFLPNIQTRNTGGTTDTLAIDPLTGVAKVTGSVKNTQSPDSAASVAATLRGQNMTDARARETLEQGRWTNDLANGIQVNMATGETRPITSNGQPIQKDPKLTEDQAKAMGWLVQADNAFKNMQKATKANPDAAKPGLPDVIAGISGPFGVGAGAAEGIANSMRGDERQQFMQASSSLSEALLRAATGAGVNESEAKQKIAELTPRIGDSDAVIKQKTEAIPLYIESLKVRSGPAALRLPEIRDRAVPKPKNVTVNY